MGALRFGGFGVSTRPARDPSARGVLPRRARTGWRKTRRVPVAALPAKRRARKTLLPKSEKGPLQLPLPGTRNVYVRPPRKDSGRPEPLHRARRRSRARPAPGRAPARHRLRHGPALQSASPVRDDTEPGDARTPKGAGHYSGSSAAPATTRSASARWSATEGLQDRVHVLGRVEGVSEVYEWCDVLVHLTGLDAFPSVPMEAMMHEKPVITNVDSCGARELVFDGENGLVVKDSYEFAAALRRYAKDPALRERHGRSGRSFVKENLSVPLLRNQMQRVLRETVSSGKARVGG
ncbi:MAG: glycosyltransferase family 4 protein [Thermoleophilaceae bacterium]